MASPLKESRWVNMSDPAQVATIRRDCPNCGCEMKRADVAFPGLGNPNDYICQNYGCEGGREPGGYNYGR